MKPGQYRVIIEEDSLSKEFPGGSVGKESACDAEDTWNMCSIPESGRSPGGGHGNPLQCSCLENPMDRGAWWAAVHRVTVRHDQNDWALVHALANAAVLHSTSEAWAPLRRISGILECCHSRMLLWGKDSKLFPRLFPENYSLRTSMLSSLQRHHLWTWDSCFQPYLVVVKYILLIFIG